MHSTEAVPRARTELTGLESGFGEANRIWSIYMVPHAGARVFPSAPDACLTLIPFLSALFM